MTAPFDSYLSLNFDHCLEHPTYKTTGFFKLYTLQNSLMSQHGLEVLELCRHSSYLCFLCIKKK